MNSTRDTDRYAGRRVLVTGAGSGIGQATTLRILAEGGTVIAADVSENGLGATESAAGDPGAQRLQTLRLDVGDEASVAEAIASVLRESDRLDNLVNAAGILRSGHTESFSVDEFDHVVRTNLRGTFLVTRECLPALRRGVQPAVVNFSSTSAAFAHPYMAAYAASKGGIQAMTHALALEYSKDGIRFNSVQPGSIASGMTDGSGVAGSNRGPGLPADSDVTLFTKLTPALVQEGGGGFADPSAAAAVVAFLGSSDARFITGTEIRVDGGTHM
ncbi:SDR family NAD(P)-dependent oxidoreductase [Tsukamurella sp. 1534]|uniref:SDR family NAD(P)-dependent oxidoreductase n=1 Tax=Tsukamurella sp. 1534 TaxID=1151061 RepID=UPI00031A6AA8|nr:SDR family NAD(P)-dependent oxidoreductase [Tsukamurella sp. 1534]